MRADALPSRRALLGLTGLSALSCLAGSAELLAFPRGNAYVPSGLLAPTPFSDFVIPGVLLGCVGVAQALAFVSLLRRGWAAIDLALLAGGALTIWIGVEIALLRTFHPLHVIFGGTGAAILGLALRGAARSDAPRIRWIVTVTLCEALGYLAPTAAGIVLARNPAPAGLVVAAMAAAGAIEGAMLGLGQALAMPFAVPRTRYVAASSAGAALVWALVMMVQQFAERGGAWGAGAGLLAGLAGATALVAIGGAQWLVLRRVRTGAGPWIAWTALAWALALPLSFLPGPLVDERSPLAVNLVVWPAGGILMAYVMAWVTWAGARRLAERA